MGGDYFGGYSVSAEASRGFAELSVRRTGAPGAFSDQPLERGALYDGRE
jgi:hypothetical protein